MKLYCGECGKPFSRHTGKSGLVIWTCRTHNTRASDCPLGRIQESEVYAAFTRMYNRLKQNEGVILQPTLRQLDDLNTALQRDNPAMLEVNRAIAQAAEQSYNTSKLRSAGLLDDDASTAKQTAISAQLTQLRAERRRLLKNTDIEENLDATRRTADVIRRGPEGLEQFDRELFAELVERITAESTTRLRFKLYGGLELTERLREEAR